MIVRASEQSRTSRTALRSTLRPTMHLVISSTLVSETGVSFTTLPSRMMTTLSHTFRTS